ncbi:hypothetical protein ONZ45_g13045 [Pleurotus djamor]|nr:hypothetical protein ONZ45_g13045 [Pleurotus djamor]
MPAFSKPFPVELIEEVISYVDSDSLPPCSLVSKTWAAICQPYFFCVLNADFENFYQLEPRFEKLDQILTQSPHLARHFEEVTLDLYSFRAFANVFDDNLPSILNRLTHVQDFHIMSKAFNYEQFSPKMCLAIDTLISSGHLVKLEFTRTGFSALETLLSLLDACSESLKELVLERIYVMYESARTELRDAALEPITFPRLELAKFKSEDAYDIATHGILDMPNLVTYKVQLEVFKPLGQAVIPNFVPFNIPTFTFTFLSSARQSFLRMSPFDKFVDSPVLPIYADLTPYTNLGFLTLSTRVSLLDEHTSLPVMASFLDRATFESLSRLEMLTIQIKLQSTETRLVCPLDWDTPGWTALDARLAAKSKAFVLFVVKLEIYRPMNAMKEKVDAATLKGLEEAMDLLEEQFVELGGAEKFDIDIEG